MNYPIQFHHHHHGRHWRKDVQFAVGVMVAVCGAAVLLAEVVHLFV